MAIDIVSFPIKNGGSFHSFFVCLPGRVSVMAVLDFNDLAQDELFRIMTGWWFQRSQWLIVVNSG